MYSLNQIAIVSPSQFSLTGSKYRIIIFSRKIRRSFFIFCFFLDKFMFFFSIIQLPPLLKNWNSHSPSSIFLFFSKFIIFLQFVLQCNKMNNFCIFVQLVGVKRLHLSFSKRIHKRLKYIPVITPIRLNECTHGACCTWTCNTYVMQNKKKHVYLCPFTHTRCKLFVYLWNHLRHPFVFKPSIKLMK